MPLRKYYLVGDGTAIDMRQKLAREKMIRSVSITSSGENVGSMKSNYICEVRKSPRAPEYEVHYVKTKKDGIQLKKRAVRRPPDKDGGSNRTLPSEDGEKIESETTNQENDDMVGLRVIACNKQDGLYYPGYVSHTPESAYAIVNFNTHKRQKVRTQMIIPMSGAIARPELAPGDFVLVRVFYQTMKSECFVPAIVEVTPEDFRHHAKFYSVLLYNGQRETTMRKFIVKIGKARFEMAIKYITHVQQQRILRQESALSESSSLPSPQSQRSKRSEDDASSTRSSQSGRGRRKKEKITKKLVHKKEESKAKKRRKSRSRSRSQSSKSSRSRSHSRSSSSSRSRSRSQSSRSQSERSKSRSDSSRSRSRSSERSGSSRTKSVSSRSRSRSSERSGSSRTKSVSSRSRSQSSERSGRSRTRSVSSRSRSRSSSSSTVRSKSSVKMSRPKSAAPPRSRSSDKSSRSRSRSRSQGSDRSKGSSTPRARSPYDRPRRPTPSAHRKTPHVRTDSVLGSADVTRKDIYNEPLSEQSHSTKMSKLVNVDEKDEVIQALQYQLEKQKRKQLRQERRLVRQARKINKIRRKIRDSDVSHNESGQSSHTDRSDRTKSRRSSSSDTDTSPQRRKGSPDGTSYGESPDLQSQRRSSPGLRMNQEVLARWRDDGWFYRGCVVADGKDQKYVIRDCTGYMETILRDDILTDTEHRFDAIQPEDHVIGLHPKYVFSYAPAEVLGTYANSSVKVEFFDGNISELTSEEVYKISKAKYEQVVEYIKRCEKNLIGLSVVARDDDTGLYKLAVVDSRVGLGQQYYIKWLDGDMSKQNANHIFEVGKRQTRHEDWSHVLAPVSQHSMTFMPAEVIQSNPFVVQFCNGKRSSDATFDQCFWLSKEYYSNARGYLMDMKYRKLTDDIHSHRDRE
ncbi:uncharacterized protein LOC123557580 isoform X2 [Mercenaria mercenaria]|uniref:uncharacterized protein LOC123557580 isoform X2 n=1 Tax=Mercenaria mercenaria TaxID=6596 RepID=UPI00234FA7CC|nr:uncharacterized protein LOC123557580 isoform X2 [Mercenaria mercenaria]